MQRAALTMILLLTVAGCGGTQGDPISVEAGSEACAPDRWRALLGKPESALRTARLPAGVRVIHPGDAVKADYAVERLNIDIGHDGVIEALRCG